MDNFMASACIGWCFEEEVDIWPEGSYYNRPTYSPLPPSCQQKIINIPDKWAYLFAYNMYPVGLRYPFNIIL